MLALRPVSTLAELTPITRVDDYVLRASRPLTDLIAEPFWEAVRRVAPHPTAELTFI